MFAVVALEVRKKLVKGRDSRAGSHSSLSQTLTTSSTTAFARLSSPPGVLRVVLRGVDTIPLILASQLLHSSLQKSGLTRHLSSRTRN